MKQLIIIVIYINDILIMCHESNAAVRQRLVNFFEMSDLEEIKRCLEINFSRNAEGIFINGHGRTYIKDVFQRFGMQY